MKKIMKTIRKHRVKSIILLVILVVLLTISFSFGRYIFNIINDHILETRGFYFNSSVLGVNNKSYNIKNWDGVNSYTLTIDLNNKKNDFLKTTDDIVYEPYVNCSSNVVCTLSKTSGIIYSSTGADSYVITITPVTSLGQGETATINTYAVSTSPYSQTLYGTYIIGTTTANFSYYIEDEQNSIFMTLKLTNSLTFYEVEQAFDQYQVGDNISLDDYNELTDDKKAKCYSAKVTLSFNPNVVNLDMTSNAYKNKISSTTRIRNGYNYVDSLTFKINATSAESIIFYKTDKTENFTYPIINQTSVVNVSVVMAS